MLYNPFQYFVTNSIIREKLYKSFLINKRIRQHFNLNINEIRIVFLLNNNILNKPIFFCLLLILEKITLNQFTFILSKQSIAQFNIKKCIKFGACYTIRGILKDQFLRVLTSYSLKKVDTSSMFISTYKNEDALRFQFAFSNLSIGFTRILFNFLFSINGRDYDIFAPIFEDMVYGFYFIVYSSYRNYFLNRLLLSQYNIVIH